MPGGCNEKTCPFCKGILPCAKKICSYCNMEQPVKPRLKKALKQFEEKREKWVSSRKKNHNLSQIKDEVVLMLEKLQAAGYKPVLLLGKPTKKEHKVQVLVPHCTLTTHATESLKEMGSIHEYVCQGWTPYVTGTESEEVCALHLTTSSVPCNPSCSSVGPSVATEVPEEGRGTTQMDMGEVEDWAMKVEVEEEEVEEVEAPDMEGPAVSTVHLQDISHGALTKKRKRKEVQSQKKILARRGKISPKDCSYHTGRDAYEIRSYVKERVRKGKTEVLIEWEPCPVCGKEWAKSWQPTD